MANDGQPLLRYPGDLQMSSIKGHQGPEELVAENVQKMR